ncbi:MAG: cytochrome c biogenesis protein CcsA [Deltaproteobacteria bacterium]|nr:cytochrome c biogenesis protein CcsA [Deltaproteobacteria bacterium]
MDALLILRFIIAALYVCASVAYIALLKSGKQQAARPTYLLGAGLVVHLAEVIARGAESGAAGGAPFASLSGFVSIFAFILGLTYFVLERRYSALYRISSLGAFHVPVLFVVYVWSILVTKPITEIPELRTGIVFVFHVVPVVCAYAALTAGFVAGVAYLLLDRQLRRKQFGVLLRGLPNLELVERVNTAAAKIGLPLLVMGIVMGFAQGHIQLGSDFELDFKVWMSLATIVIFSVQLGLRRFGGWAGRRSVILSVIGFASILTNATIVNVFSPFHGVG